MTSDGCSPLNAKDFRRYEERIELVALEGCGVSTKTGVCERALAAKPRINASPEALRVGLAPYIAKDARHRRHSCRATIPVEMAQDILT